MNIQDDFWMKLSSYSSFNTLDFSSISIKSNWFLKQESKEKLNECIRKSPVPIIVTGKELASVRYLDGKLCFRAKDDDSKTDYYIFSIYEWGNKLCGTNVYGVDQYFDISKEFSIIEFI